MVNWFSAGQYNQSIDDRKPNNSWSACLSETIVGEKNMKENVEASAVFGV